MKTSSCKAKGRRLQQQVVSSILRAFPALQSGDVRSTSMGAQGEDILLSPAALNCLGKVSIECKNQETCGPLYKWMAQANGNLADPDYTPIVVSSRNREATLVTMYLSDFLLMRGGNECAD